MFFIANSSPPEPNSWEEPQPNKSSQRKKWDPGIRRVLCYYAAFATMFVVVASGVVYFGLGLERDRRAQMLVPPTADEVRLVLQVSLDDTAGFQGVLADRDMNQFVFRLSTSGVNTLRHQLEQAGWTPLSSDVFAKRRGGSLVMLYNVKIRPTATPDQFNVLLVWRRSLASDPTVEIPDRFLEEHVLTAWQGGSGRS